MPMVHRGKLCYSLGVLYYHIGILSLPQSWGSLIFLFYCFIILLIIFVVLYYYLSGFLVLFRPFCTIVLLFYHSSGALCCIVLLSFSFPGAFLAFLSFCPIVLSSLGIFVLLYYQLEDLYQWVFRALSMLVRGYFQMGVQGIINGSWGGFPKGFSMHYEWM